MSALKIRSFGELLAAAPILLGFVPRRSLVLIDLTPNGVLGATARTDLELRPSGQVSRASVEGAQESVRMLAHACEDFYFSDLVAVVVHDSVSDRDEVARQVRGMLDGHNVRSVLVVTELRADASWWCDCCARTGTVADYRSVPALTQLAAHEGVPVESREAMVAMLAPCTAVVATARVEAARAAQGTDGAADAARDLIGAAQAADGIGALTDERVAQLAAAVLDPFARDVFVGMAFTPSADQARELVRQIATRVRGAARAEALTAYAAFAYVAGDGPMVGIALDAAFKGRRPVVLARLLAAAFSAGAHPDEVGRLLAQASIAHAEHLGVKLPGIDPAMDPRDDAQVVAEGLA
ncbi:DUF4192 domain-containing protein [Tsukamurella hominis]|uniref:DUF4192 domain-containing protein n=1 Tax=Tsukamurella hominis TaxID=1970232 RepID=UPI0039E86F75